MFLNIGEKIMTFAKMLCWVEIVAFVIIGCVMIPVGNAAEALILILGAFIAWVSSWFMYGFGQLIADVHRLAYKDDTTIFDDNSADKEEVIIEESFKNQEEN